VRMSKKNNVIPLANSLDAMLRSAGTSQKAHNRSSQVEDIILIRQVYFEYFEWSSVLEVVLYSSRCKVFRKKYGNPEIPFLETNLEYYNYYYSMK
jgi:hypothetical protein